MASNIMKSQQFKCSNLEKYTNRVLRVILVDIMQPKVLLEYLTDNEIEYVQKMGVTKWQKVQIVLDDHCYFIKRNTVVRQGIRKSAAKLSVQSNHHTNMTTSELDSTNDTSHYSPGYNDASSIDSNDIWYTSIQSNENEENISQYSEIESNTSSPYRMSETDLQEIYEHDNEMATNNMNLQSDDNSLDSYSDEFDDGDNNVNNMNDSFDMNDEYYDDGEEEEFENDENDFVDFESIITQLTDKGGPQNTDEHGNTWCSTEKVFNNICLKHLHNKCNDYELMCRFNHNMPETAIVARNLHRADVTVVEEAHQMLMLYDKLLIKYWPSFCSFYGRVNWRENLRLSIGPLSLMEGLCIEYNLLSHILDGFIKTGMNYALCVQQIMLELDESLGPEEQFYLVWQIIMDPRNTAIKLHLEKYTDVMVNDLSSLNVNAIKEMLTIQIANESIDIRSLTVNILKRCNVTIFQSIDPAVLTEYILYLRAYDEIGSKTVQLRANSLPQQMR